MKSIYSVSKIIILGRVVRKINKKQIKKREHNCSNRMKITKVFTTFRQNVVVKEELEENYEIRLDSSLH